MGNSTLPVPAAHLDLAVARYDRGRLVAKNPAWERVFGDVTLRDGAPQLAQAIRRARPEPLRFLLSRDGEEVHYVGHVGLDDQLTGEVLVRPYVDRMGAHRNQRMLDHATVPLLYADADFIITGLNERMVRFLDEHGSLFRSMFPAADFDHIIGQCIDLFNTNPSHQRSMLKTVPMPHTSRVSVAGLTLEITVDEDRGQDGAVLGYAVQWSDLTEIVAYQERLERFIEGASHGDTHQRIDADGLSADLERSVHTFNQVLEYATAPVAEVREVMNQAANRDLTPRVRGHYEGDHKTLAQDVNRMMANIDGAVAGIHGFVMDLSGGASEMGQAAASLADGATTQASALDDITVSVAEMTQLIKLNAKDAATADALSGGVEEAARVGHQQMHAMLQAIQDIETKGESIRRVIKVIDEIAFQTNLLALNAAVEAARAGVHGKGFAVVAEEVRNLAARSATAARETADMIDGTIASVGQGTELAGKTAASLDAIVGRISEVVQKINRMALASEEQAQGIEAINLGLGQVYDVTSLNTAAAEQTSAASQELARTATQLSNEVARFVFTKEGQGGGAGELDPELLAAFQAFLASRG